MALQSFMNDESQEDVLGKVFHLSATEVAAQNLNFHVATKTDLAKSWPEDYFASIQIDDENFVRPDQGVIERGWLT